MSDLKAITAPEKLGKAGVIDRMLAALATSEENSNFIVINGGTGLGIAAWVPVGEHKCKLVPDSIMYREADGKKESTQGQVFASFLIQFIIDGKDAGFATLSADHMTAYIEYIAKGIVTEETEFIVDISLAADPRYKNAVFTFSNGDRFDSDANYKFSEFRQMVDDLTAENVDLSAFGHDVQPQRQETGRRTTGRPVPSGRR